MRPLIAVLFVLLMAFAIDSPDARGGAVDQTSFVSSTAPCGGFFNRRACPSKGCPKSLPPEIKPPPPIEPAPVVIQSTPKPEPEPEPEPDIRWFFVVLTGVVGALIFFASESRE